MTHPRLVDQGHIVEISDGDLEVKFAVGVEKNQRGSSPLMARERANMYIIRTAAVN